MNNDFNILSYHLKDKINIDEILEVRHIRVFKIKKLDSIIDRLPHILIFYDNDLVEFKDNGIPESFIDFFIVKSGIDLHLVGLTFIFHDNGLKDEKLISYKKISKLMAWLLSSKYNRKYSRQREPLGSRR